MVLPRPLLSSTLRYLSSTTARASKQALRATAQTKEIGSSCLLAKNRKLSFLFDDKRRGSRIFIEQRPNCYCSLASWAKFIALQAPDTTGVNEDLSVLCHTGHMHQIRVGLSPSSNLIEGGGRPPSPKK